MGLGEKPDSVCGRAEELSITSSEGALLVGVRVSPAARKSRLVGLYGDRLKVQVAAPPEGGRANRELLSLLRKELGVPAATVELRAGLHSRDKTVAVRGLDREDLLGRLSRLLRQT